MQTLLKICIIFYLLFPHLALTAHNWNERVELTTKPMDLSVPPSVKELMAAGQLGGVLYPTSDIEEVEISDQQIAKHQLTARSIRASERIQINRNQNLSFGRAIQEWNRHKYDHAVNLFKEHMIEYPDSPWSAEASLHIGCDARYQGRYQEAEEAYNWIINKFKDNNHFGAKKLIDKATLRLGTLDVLRNRFPQAKEHFSTLKRESSDWRQRTYAASWLRRLSSMSSQNNLALVNCGTQALAAMLAKTGNEQAARRVERLVPDNPDGYSLKNLQVIASEYGYNLKGLRLTTPELNLIQLPAIIQTGGSRISEEGHYFVLEEIEGEELVFHDPQRNSRFTLLVDQFTSSWDGIALVFSTQKYLPGELIALAELENIYGGCCGVPAPPSDLGPPDYPSDEPPDDCKRGAPIWSVNVVSLNLYVADTPLWYSNPIGPDVDISLSYNSQSAIAYNEPFGNKWQFNYSSYAVVDTGGSVLVFMPGGRNDLYSPDGSGGYISPYKVYNELVKIAENHFELHFPDDTVFVYNIPSGTTSLQPFLLEIKDAYGQSLNFNYNTEVQLTTITDALGRSSTLTYNVDGLVAQVSDPFGRTAVFEYDVNRNLVKISDMGGYWSELSYDEDVYLTSISNSRGEWQFFIEPSDGIANYNSNNYPPPGTDMWENYRVTITNPVGGREEYFFYGSDGGYVTHIKPKDYVGWRSHIYNNFRNGVPKTKYLFTLTDAGQRGEVETIVYPDGSETRYSYDIVTGDRISITDDHQHTTTYTYNNMGNVLSTTDAIGVVTTNTYSADGIDLLQNTNGLGSRVMTYNDKHNLISVTDRRGYETTFLYDTYGKLTSTIEADGVLDIVTTYAYDPASHQLLQISKAGSVLKNMTYDTIGRIRTQTDVTGLTLTYDYDNLNHVTKVTYPDGKFLETSYSGCCPRLKDSETDRAGRTTYYTYDEMERLATVTNPAGESQQYIYDFNSNLKEFSDANGNVTSFEYDNNNRLTKKTYADGIYKTFLYDGAGLLTRQTNGRGDHKDYAYDVVHNLTSVNYSDTTPDVTYQYDDYGRLIQSQAGAGPYLFNYDAESNLLQSDGPWTQDTLVYQYDALGRKIVVTPTIGQSIAYAYDDFNRLIGVDAGINHYSYNYINTSPLVQELTRANSSVTSYQYDNLNRLTEISNRDSVSTVINQHAFTYNQQDMRDSEDITNGIPISTFTEQLVTYDYNRVNQLLSTTNPTKAFTYDNDGNMVTGYTPEGYIFSASYDAENRLYNIEYTDSGSVVHKIEYTYKADHFLNRAVQYQNSVVTRDTRFVIDGFLPLQERSETNAITREYAWGHNMGGGIGGLLELKQGGQGYSYLYDGKGNVTSLLNNSQTVVANYTYDVFGNLMTETGVIDQPYKFSTKRYTEKTGLSYYGYRFYLPLIGRWINRDPLGERGGINLYRVVQNNPVTFIDPFGLQQSDGQVSDLSWVERKMEIAKENVNKYKKNIRDFAEKCWGELCRFSPAPTMCEVANQIGKKDYPKDSYDFLDTLINPNKKRDKIEKQVNEGATISKP